MSEEIQRKLSAKLIMGEKPKLKDGQKERRLFIIFGVATGLKKSPDMRGYGESVGLTGNFEATNLDTGESFVSGRCYLPEPSHSMIVAQVSQGKTVEFGYEIGIKANDTAIGYEYTTKPVVKPGDNDPLKALRDQIKNAVALPAPQEKKPGAAAKK